MAGKIFLNFLILGAILSQVIIGTLAEENIKESPSLLVRHKRVYNVVPGQDNTALLADHPYIVHLKYMNRISCVGTILSQRVVISTAECVQHDENEYKVISRTVRTNQVIAAHNVTQIRKRYGNHPDRRFDGVALLTIDPPIVYGTTSSKINLHTGPIIPGMIGTVSGWGFNFRNKAEGRGTQYPKELRSNQVAIIPHRDCTYKYRNFYAISDSEICTYDEQRHCGHNDFGAPLVMNESLVGIFLRSGPIAHCFNPLFPDVFVLLQHTDYKAWIMDSI